MNDAPRIFAIVPAAGLSRRMGQAKQLMDVGGRPMLLRLAESMAAVDAISGVIIVTRRAIAEALGWTSASPIDGKLQLAFNEDDSSEMVDSVRIGLRAMGETWGQTRAGMGEFSPHDGILICPGDYPRLTTAAFAACAEAYRAEVMHDSVAREATSRSAESGCAEIPSAVRAPIIVASHGGRRGHPMIFPADLIPFVASPACDGGLNALTREFADRMRLVELPTDAVLRDADTPDDLADSEWTRQSEPRP